MDKNKILITCAKGIAPYLSAEIEALGMPVVSETTASIGTEGTFEDAMRLNLMLRTGLRVLFLLKEFEADDSDELYREVSKIDWENIIDEDGYISVSSSVDNPTIRDSRFPNVKCKDAITDRLTEKRGRRPDSGPLQDRTVINLYWKESRCAIYIDTSGEPLSKRGYRKIPMQAPMQETLAAAVIMAAGWDIASNFINPMCGSGTLAIEAAMAALKMPPGILRDNYGFMHVKWFDKKIWLDMRADAESKILKSANIKIMATDIRRDAIDAAKKNAELAGVKNLIEFRVCPFEQTTIPEGSGIVILNPEYGERMGKSEELESVYHSIGDFFKQKCSGYKGYIFTGNMELAKKVGLRSKRKIPFYNSAIECRLLEYELYQGSRKSKYSDSNDQRLSGDQNG
ncbi:MAG: class I SAM-dependent RNA methyltransferase [Nitrospirae bacterium]|nr:class I SAM-dependent RNA methyltransferase [Nitrospirota bacterium]